MSFTETKRQEIKKYLLRKIDEDDANLIDKVSDAFEISATSVRRYLDAEIKEKHIEINSKAKCGYALTFTHKKLNYDLDQISEQQDIIIYDDFFPYLKTNDNGRKIWSYTLAEIMNNSIEHSMGDKVTVIIDTCFLYSRVSIVDDGIGIFKNITEYIRNTGRKNAILEDAIVELYKGKFTSKPENHSGEGIYFSLKLLDRIAIVSDGLLVRSGYLEEASYLKSHILEYAMKLSKKGTVVMMQLDNDTNRKAGSIFDTYADVDDGFFKTRIPVLEACLDHEPISRSQARRIVSRLESFKEVELDFNNVEFMAQGFADEIFRVFPNNHPETKVTPLNMNAEVKKMYLYTIHNKVTAPKFSE